MSGVDRLSGVRARASSGEWRVCDGHPIAYMGDDPLGEIRYVGTMGAMGDPAADAELMAAAPELHDALEELAGVTGAKNHAEYAGRPDGVPEGVRCGVCDLAAPCPWDSARALLARLSGDREGGRPMSVYTATVINERTTVGQLVNALLDLDKLNEFVVEAEPLDGEDIRRWIEAQEEYDHRVTIRRTSGGGVALCVESETWGAKNGDGIRVGDVLSGDREGADR